MVNVIQSKLSGQSYPVTSSGLPRLQSSRKKSRLFYMGTGRLIYRSLNFVSVLVSITLISPGVLIRFFYCNSLLERHSLDLLEGKRTIILPVPVIKLCINEKLNFYPMYLYKQISP